MKSDLHHQMADALHTAERTRTAIAPLSESYGAFDEEDAYAVQLMNAARALKDGRRLVGYKLGLTSREAQRHFKVFEPDFGHLFDDMARADGATIDLSGLIQPKIEGEIAFLLGRDLRGPGVTIMDVMAATAGATAAFEIIDSRIRDWKISARDTIADNGSSALFALAGAWRKLEGLDLATVGMALSRNGEVEVTGAGAAVMGNPLSAVVFLANELGRHGRTLLAGEIILSGSLGGMLPMEEGDLFTCEIAKLGSLNVRVSGSKKESK